MTLAFLIGLMGASDPAAHLEQAVIGNRQRIKSGVVRVQATVKLDMSSGIPGRVRTHKATIYFDEVGFRGDFVVPYGGSDGRTYVRSSVFTKDAMLFYSNADRGKGQTEAVVKVPLNNLYAETYIVPDPRRIGMAPSTFMDLARYKLNSFLGQSAHAASASVEPATFQGAECRLLRCQYSEKVRLAAWIDAARDFNVVKMEMSFEPFREVMECSLAKVSGFGWFPRRVVARRFHNDKLETEEVLEVQVEQFNQQLPAETFTFAGMGVAPGRDVHDKTQGRTEIRTWDGQKLVDRVVADVPVTVDSSAFRKQFLLGNSVLMGVIASILLWRWGRAGKR